jgi:uncharacterized protein YkwD
MKRRTLVIAVTSAMLAVGSLGVLFVAAEPVPPTPATGSPGRDKDVTSLPALPTATPTPTSAPPIEAPPAEPAPAPEPASDPAEGEVLALVNEQRAANGCAALAWDEGLAGVARSHSADMAARDYFSHTTPEGVDPFQRAAAAGLSAHAENIAAGQGSAAEVMDGWMNSPGHRANILNCSLTRLGVGVGYGGSYGIYWTQLFG